MSERRGAPRALAAVLVVALCAACAPTGVVVLLPEKDGRKTAVNVQQEDKGVLLDQPYAAAQFTRLGPKPFQADPKDVDARFGATLAALPARAMATELNFVLGTNELTDESKAKFEQVFPEIKNRPVVDILVVGHTDAVGSHEQNDALSLKRAEAVRDELVRRGIATESIQVTGRGKRALKKPTADGVAEPENRRVEIFVR